MSSINTKTNSHKLSSLISLLSPPARCSAWPLRPHELVDSTGAGDAFIGGFISGWLSDYSDAECMTLGSAVAAAKLGKKGARQGLPSAVEINNRIRTITTSSSK